MKSLSLLPFVLFCIGFSQFVHGQLIAPAVSLDGRSGQPYVCVVRYYDQQQAIHSTVVTRGEIARIGDSKTELPLDLGHSGLRVAVAAVGYERTSVELTDGDQTLAARERSSPGMIVLSAGEVPADPTFPELSPFPGIADQELIGNFLHAVQQVDSRGMVSDLPLANIDWPSLDAYLLALHQVLGDIQYPPADRAFGDWLVWEGSLGARVFSGRIRFERGACDVRLMTIDGQLVDFEPRAPQLPADWYQRPPDCDAYIAQAHALLRGLFAGDALGSQLLFSPRYHEEVTVDSIAQLSNALREKYGTQVTELRFVDYQFVDEVPAEPKLAAASEGGGKVLSIDSYLTLDSGKSCIGRVVFAIPAGRDLVGRAHLRSFFVTESLTSAHPEKARKLRELLSVLRTSSPADVAATWYNQLAEPLRESQSVDKLENFIEQLVANAGQPLGETDLALWSFTDGDKQTTSGTVIFNTGQELQVTVHWLGEQLYGLSFVGAGTAFSSLDIVPTWSGDASPAEHSQRFWKALLSGDAAAAHALLGNEFQQTASVADLEQIVIAEESAEGKAPPRLIDIKLDRVRLQGRDNRSAPLAIAVHQLATFGDGSYLPLFSEYAWEAAGTEEHAFELRAFSTDFEATYPLDDPRLANEFARRFAEQRAEELIERLPPGIRSAADVRLLKPFMAVVHDALGQSVQLSPQLSMLRRIEQGRSLLEVHGRLVGTEVEIPFRAMFEREQLLEFRLEHPALSAWAEQLRDFAPLDEQLKTFMNSWHDTGKLAEGAERLAPLLNASLRTPPALERLGELQRRYQLEFGNVNQITIERHGAIGQSNDIEVDARVEFQRGAQLFRVTFTIDAMRATIVGLEVVEPQPAR